MRLRVRALDDALALQRLLDHVRALRPEEGVAALWLHLEAAPGGWSATESLREAIAQARSAGVATFAFMESADNLTLWIASACETVFLVPVGEVALVGVGAELTFLGGLLDHFGVEADFEAAGAYKSFGETFTRTHASPPNLEAIGAIVRGVNDELVRGVAEGRGLDPGLVRELVVRGPHSAAQAQAAGLVDQLAYEDEAVSVVDRHIGARVVWRDFGWWSWRRSWLDRLERLAGPGPRVAVLHLSGAIVGGGEGKGVSIDPDVVRPRLKALREDPRVRGVVLQVDSPGGSALASDLIWREVELLGRAKPVVASFADTAASGGFYLSAPAVRIFARSTTLTGSIGVFGGKIVWGGAAARWGVHAQPVLAAPHAAVFSPGRRFSPSERAWFRASLDRVYDTFVGRVAVGRRAPLASIEPVCRGRVWTGRDAVAAGLVDDLGGLPQAIEAVCKLASLDAGAYAVVHLDAKPPRPLLSRLLGDLLPAGLPGLGALAPWLPSDRSATWARLLSRAEALAMLPFELRIR